MGKELAIVQSPNERVVVLRYDESYGDVGGAVHVQLYTREGMDDTMIDGQHLAAVAELFQTAAAAAAEIKLRKSAEEQAPAAPIGTAVPPPSTGVAALAGPFMSSSGGGGANIPPGIMKTLVGAAIGGLIADAISGKKDD